MKTSNMDYIVDKFWRFLPESLIVSMIAPFFFIVLDFVWVGKDKGLIGEDS
jgi:hypothetical protein